jgi:hypothetical protein
MTSYPDDFSFRFRWQLGSVPPPYYYEYTIKINADGTGDIELLPDYPQHHPQKRTAPLRLNKTTINYLFEEMQSAGLFENVCPEVESNWTGGSQASLDVHAWGKEYHVPYSISSADLHRMEPVYLAIQELIPAQMLKGLPGL